MTDDAITEMKPSPAVAELAEALFNAYNSTAPNPWETFDGRKVPPWSALTEQVRRKWYGAAAEALRRQPEGHS